MNRVQVRATRGSRPFGRDGWLLDVELRVHNSLQIKQLLSQISPEDLRNLQVTKQIKGVPLSQVNLQVTKQIKGVPLSQEDV